MIQITDAYTLSVQYRELASMLEYLIGNKLIVMPATFDELKRAQARSTAFENFEDTIKRFHERDRVLAAMKVHLSDMERSAIEFRGSLNPVYEETYIQTLKMIIDELL